MRYIRMSVRRANRTPKIDRRGLAAIEGLIAIKEATAGIKVPNGTTQKIMRIAEAALA